MENSAFSEDLGSGARAVPASAPREIHEGVRRVAADAGHPEDAVWLAARWKTASVLTGEPDLSGEPATWRDLVKQVSQAPEAARAAWAGVLADPRFGSGAAEGFLLTAVRGLTAGFDQDHRRTPLLTPDEAEELVTASAGPVRPLPERRFHELFEERVRQHPDTVAAVQGGRGWTYAELNRAANKIAWHLAAGGLAPQDVVAVVAERTLEWLAAVLGVLKAGGCYLPLEPHFPAERIGTVLDRSECRRVLAEPGVPHLGAALAARPAVVPALIDEVVAAPGRDDDPGVPVAADDLAYIYFTSGSTGEPKGAMCEHAGFLNHLYAKIEDLGIQEGDAVAQTAPQCFDISLWQLVSALMLGGRTHIIEQDAILDVGRFLDTLEAADIRIVQLVPSYLDVVLSTLRERPRTLSRLRCVAVTGEALKKELVQRWFAAFPALPLVNCYGTTEVSDDTNHGILHGVPDRPAVPLGPPLRNVRVYVMDEFAQLVPPGAPGEIVFAGVCVGRGYVNDPDRTAAVFGQDPYRPQDRLYRSGDFGRRLPDGLFEYLGRRDSQVKVSGFRIEIGEIENRMAQVPGVRDAAVVIAGSADEPQLVGYYAGPSAPAPEAVAAALAETLPDYMVPHRLYPMDQLPLSANGKIDKKGLTALARAAASLTAARASQAPVGVTEQRVAALWSQLLHVPVERIGRDSEFAELGGTSLAAIRLAIALDRVVTVADLKDTPTVAAVAALVERRLAEPAGPAGPAGSAASSTAPSSAAGHA